MITSNGNRKGTNIRSICRSLTSVLDPPAIETATSDCSSCEMGGSPPAVTTRRIDVARNACAGAVRKPVSKRWIVSLGVSSVRDRVMRGVSDESEAVTVEVLLAVSLCDCDGETLGELRDSECECDRNRDTDSDRESKAEID